jgi:NitT/TauT family transport system substrate-binding protein
MARSQFRWTTESPTISRRALLAGAAAIAAAPRVALAQKLDRVVFGTNWRAQGEHGGFYQAVATDIYRRQGLDVTIRQGGPQINSAQLLASGRLDFNMGASLFGALNYVVSGVPIITVAAIFQKDPQILMAHPGQGNDTLEALKGKPIMISAGAQSTYWQFLKQRFGYTDDQIRPYTFQLAPFLADKKAIQQGYLTSEPFKAEKAGVKPVVLLLADGGYTSYTTTIETRAQVARDKAGVVQRFVDASIEGWYGYMNGDPAPANALIRRDNPDMTDDLLAYSRDAMKRHGIVVSGDALSLGIGAMTDARWKGFFETMAKAGVFKPSLDYRRAYTLGFVNKKVGMK